ncbi:MAG: EAL domain-containing protein [Burkholderiales bacterium]|nr:EAL domain-containing protein [Burkholderiales bacterium]
MFSPISDRTPFSGHAGRISPAQLLDLMRRQRYGVEYQPIVELASGDILAYEALARFYAADGLPLAPKPVFDALHASPLSLYHVEYDMKQLQLSYAPRETLLFVNLDPDTYGVTAGDAEDPLLELMSMREGLVVEIIENSDVSDAHLSQLLTKAFSARGVRLALDDIGAPNSMVSLDVMMVVDWFKFDRSWITRAREPRSRAALRHLIGFAHECGCRVILEGVERPEDLVLARELEVDCVQGYYYRKHFIGVSQARPNWTGL